MRTGDIDGKNIIYDKEGVLILEEGEIIRSRISSAMMTLNKNWSPFGKIIFDGGWGRGTIFITDRRIVFIRRPDINSIKYGRLIGTDGLYGDMSWYREAIAHAEEVNSFHAFDYLEIRYEDVAHIKRGPLNRRICINWMDKYSSFIIPSYMTRLILPILMEKGILKRRPSPRKARKIAIPKNQ